MGQELDWLAAMLGLERLASAGWPIRAVAAMIAILIFYYAAPWRFGAQVSSSKKSDSVATETQSPTPQPSPEKSPVSPVVVTAESGGVIVLGTVVDIRIGNEVIAQRADSSYQQGGVEIARPHAYILWPGGSWSNRPPYLTINRENKVREFLRSNEFQQSTAKAQSLICLGLASHRWSEPQFAGSQWITDSRAHRMCSLLLEQTDQNGPQFILGVGMGHNLRPPNGDIEEERQRALVFLLIEPTPGEALNADQTRQIVFDLLTTPEAIVANRTGQAFNPLEYSRAASLSTIEILQIERGVRLKP